MDAFCWIDLETTGLDPYEDFVLEIGVKVTDFRFNDLYSFHAWVTDPFAQWCVDRMDDFVRQMHTHSGLLTDAEGVNKDDFYFVKGYRQLDIDFSGHLEFCKQAHGIDTLYPAGSSVHFDMAFLTSIGLPQTLELLSHRHMDVTTLKLCSQAQTGFYPETQKVMPEHRALSDIESSILAARQFVSLSQDTALQADHVAKVVEAQLDD